MHILVLALTYVSMAPGNAVKTTPNHSVIKEFIKAWPPRSKNNRSDSCVLFAPMQAGLRGSHTASCWVKAVWTLTWTWSQVKSLELLCGCYDGIQIKWFYLYIHHIVYIYIYTHISAVKRLIQNKSFCLHTYIYIYVCVCVCGVYFVYVLCNYINTNTCMYVYCLTALIHI